MGWATTAHWSWRNADRTRVIKRVPVLGHIPVIGLLFTNTRNESTERELMVVVSPEVVTPSASAMPSLPMMPENK